MAIFLKKFETQAAYEAAQSELILPNVSLTVDNNTVHYNPGTPVPPTPSHDYVEIGGIKWATMNVGATGITDTGLYFAWGDTQGYTAAQVGSGEGQKYFSKDDYKWAEDGAMTKYNSTDGKTVLDAEDDAVTAAWGGNWRTPTASEFIALGEAVATVWTQVNGVYGLQCTDKTDSSKVLFFPAVGNCNYGVVYEVGSDGYYWSSLLDAECGDEFAFSLNFDSSSDVAWGAGSSNRAYGYSVRGVLDE